MDDSKWERYAALGGFVFVVLSIISGFLPGTPPAANAAPVKIGNYFRDHSGAIRAAQVLAGFSVVGLAWWFGSVYRRMRAAEQGSPRLSVVAILGLALGGSMALLSGAITATLGLRFNSFGDVIGRGMYQFSYVAIATAGFGVLVFIAAVVALNVRAKMFPAWSNYLGWLAAAGFVIGGFGAGSDRTAFQAIGFIAFLVWCLWIVAISTFLWRGETA